MRATVFARRLVQVSVLRPEASEQHSVQPTAPNGAPESLDFAVVGLGIAGLYAALRLVEEAGVDPSRIGLFEASGRVGGRLRTFAFDAAPSLGIDVGAMLLWPDSHRRLAKLLEQTGLQTRPFPVRSKESPIKMRGRRLRFREVKARAPHRLFPFSVSRKTQALGVNRLLREFVAAIHPDVRTLTEAGWDDLYRYGMFKGRPLREWGTYEALKEALPPEHLAYLEARVGFAMYTRSPSLLNGLEAITDLVTQSGPCRTIVGGFEKLAFAVEARLRHHGLYPRLGMRLDCLNGPDQPEGMFELTLRTADDRGEIVRARNVILALPRRAIEAIAEFPLRSRFARLLETVEPWPFGKAMLLYERPWWLGAGIQSGHALSDGPLRQVWYFGTEAGRTEGEGADGYGVTMPFFDGDALGHWQQLASGGEDLGQGLNLFGPEHPLSAALHAEVVRLHAGLGAAIPPPLQVALQDWSVAPFGGATHVWTRGVDRRTGAEAMLRPVRDANLFICGEAWSRLQGWVEGALASTDALLEAHFGLAPKV